MMKRVLPVIAAGIFLATVWPAGAAVKKHVSGWAESDVPQATIPLLPASPAIDGTIDPVEWRGAVAFTGFSLPMTFVNVLPDAFQAVVWAGYDKKNLYLAFRTPKIPGWTARVKENDKPIGVTLGGEHWWLKFHTPKGGYEFTFNPLGAFSDRNNANSYTPEEGLSWQSGAAFAQKSDDRSWSVELAIPLAAMGYPEGPADNEEWRVHLMYSAHHAGEWQVDWNGSTNWTYNRCSRIVFGGRVPGFQFTRIAGLEDGKLLLEGNAGNLTGAAQEVTVRVAVYCAQDVLWQTAEKLTLTDGGSQPFKIEKSGIVIPEDFAGRVEIAADSATDHLYSMIVQFAPLAAADYRYLAKVFYPYDSPLRQRWGLECANYPYHSKLEVFADVLYKTLPEPVQKATACILELRSAGGGKPLRTGALELKDGKGSLLWDKLDLDDGEYILRGQLRGAAGDAVGEPVEHRFERRVYPWEHNTIGKSDQPYAPFTPIRKEKAAGGQLLFSPWGRQYAVGDNALPGGITATAETDVPGQVICGPLRLAATTGTTTELLKGKTKVGKTEPGMVNFRSETKAAAGFAVKTEAFLQYDGWYQVRLTVLPAGKTPAKLDQLELVIPFGTYADTHYGYRDNWFYGGLAAQTGVLWNNVSKERGSKAGNLFVPALALGNGDVCLWWYANSDAGWPLDYTQPSQLVTRDADGVNLRIRFVNHAIELKEPFTADFALLANPARPQAPDRRATGWGLIPRKYWQDTGGYGYWGIGVDSITCGTDAEYKRLREFLDRWTGRTKPENQGFITVLYNSGQAIGRCQPEFDTFSGEWCGRTPIPVTPEFKDSDFSARVGYVHPSANYYQDWRGQPKKLVPGWGRLTPSLVDCRVWHYRQNLQKAGINGYWFDNQPITAGDIVATGDAYLTPAGAKRATYNVFERHDLFRRMFVMSKELGYEPFNLISYGPDFSFAQWIWMIEMDAYVYRPGATMYETLSQQRWYDVISRITAVDQTPLDPVARHRAITRMRSVPGGTASNVERGNIQGSRSVLGLALLHDFAVSGGVDDTELHKFRKILRRFDFGGADIAYFPYWRNAAYTSYSEPGVVVSLFHEPKRNAWLGIAVNPSENEISGRLTLNVKATGVASPILRDPESDASIAAEGAGETLTAALAIPGRTHRLFVLRPRSREDVEYRVTGTLDREYWLKIPGREVAALTGCDRFPDRPDGKDELKETEAIDWAGSGRTRGFAQDFGERIRGFLVPRETGPYLFWIAGGNESQLLLSTDEKPENRQLVARVPLNTGQRQWAQTPDNPAKSAPVTIEAGRVYYLEILHKMGTGDGHLAVAWTTPYENPARPTGLIPAAVLSAFSKGVPAVVDGK